MRLEAGKINIWIWFDYNLVIPAQSFGAARELLYDSIGFCLGFEISLKKRKSVAKGGIWNYLYTFEEGS